VKKLVILACISFLCITCKKTSASLGITGKWILYSYQVNPGTGSLNVNTSQYPCLAANVLQINTDNTAITSYIGKDICYISAPDGNQPDSRLSVGIVGQMPDTGIWSRSGNNIYIEKEHYITYYTLSVSIGQSYLTTRDTSGQSEGFIQPIVISKTYIKE
jgi:hypothetical protein